jgi:DNA modification methylase
MSNNKSTQRIEEFIEEEAEPEALPRTEIPKQFEFYRVPKRFGSIPVDELPLGCDKDEQYYKIYPRVPLPFQKADRISFGHPKPEPNRLFWGDNLHVMRMLPSESIDLIYIDPPFFSGRQYNVIFGDQNEVRSFSDIWEGGMPGYLVWLNARLLEMKRLLKPTGSIYVHLDWHAVHYVKVELDKIFGYGGTKNEPGFRSQIIWSLGNRGGNTTTYPKNYESILFYTKSSKFKFYPPKKPYSEKLLKTLKKDEKGWYYTRGSRTGRRPLADWERESGIGKKTYVDFEHGGTRANDLWIEEMIAGYESMSKEERIGYPTQKPEKLLERIILATTEKGDIVADFFCGGGTTPAVAQCLGRSWIACDISRIAVAVTLDRLMTNMNSTKSEVQTILQENPDISVEYWGTYEIPALTELSQEEFTRFIVSAYNGRISTGGKYIHGYKQGVPLYVGPASQERPVTKEDVIEFVREITTKRGLKRGNMLAWAFAPSAQQVANRLQADGSATLEFIKLSLVRIESEDFREHVTSKHKEYEKLLTFILPPEVRFRHKRIAPLTYEFDISESISVNPGGKIANVQWDFDFKGRFISTVGYSFVRDDKNAPVLKVKYQFERPSRRSIACRIQDDLGGEKTHIEEIMIQ